MHHPADWLHFDIVLHARSEVEPMTVEGMSPLLDEAGLLPDRTVPRPDRREAPCPEAAVDMFLYMLGNMVSVVGRNEPVRATNGVIMVRDIALVGLLLAEQGWRAPASTVPVTPSPSPSASAATSPMRRTRAADVAASAGTDHRLSHRRLPGPGPHLLA